MPTTADPVPTTTTTTTTTPPSPHLITLRSPLKYNPKLPSSSGFKPPPLAWLERTWTVTHSTLPMWKAAKNVRITYRTIAPTTATSPTLLDDEVTSQPLKKSWMPYMAARVKGVDTPVPVGPDGCDRGWNWRGKGVLRIASSHWEVLGWGESEVVGGVGEKWVVTWFAPSMFTPAGLDVYCDRKEGISDGLFGEIERALGELEAVDMAEMWRRDGFKVVIDN